MGRFKNILLLVVGAVAGVFVLQNTDSADAHFLFWKASMPIAALLLLNLGLGFLLGVLVGYREAKSRRP